MAGKETTELCLEDRIQIEKFLKLGYKLGSIANILGRSHAGIKLEISRNGCRSNYKAETAHQAARSRKEAGIRSQAKNLTPSEIEQINAMVSENKSLNAICQSVGITYHQLNKYLKRHGISTTPMHYTGFDMRIRALESQMEIVLEKIKEIYEQN